MHIVEKNFKEFAETLTNQKVYIAYSGGVDSQVLLHLSAKYLSGRVTALHVNHGISSNALKWETFCKETAEKLNVDFKAARFELGGQDSNLEAIARDCRYGFFGENVKANEYLMTGHHLDDQAETFMLRLMRGSGIDGLASMDQVRDFEQGSLIRPLLDVSKEEIIEFANEQGLSWVEDESNKSSDYDRNFIRNEVMPLLKTRWSKANKSIASSVKHCQNVKEEMKQEDKELFEKTESDNKLNTEVLKTFSKDKQNRVIRFWLKKNNALMPDRKSLSVILNEVAFSSADSQACYTTKHYELRKAFDELYFLTGETINFETLKNCIQSSEMNNLRMNYKGKDRTFKYVMKAEKVPYWERNNYLASIDKNGKVLAFGNVYSK